MGIMKPPKSKKISDEVLLAKFKECYEKEMKSSSESFFHNARTFELDNKLNQNDAPDVQLKTILRHGLQGKTSYGFGKNRTRKILEQLKWMHPNGTVNWHYSGLRKIHREIKLEDNNVADQHLTKIRNNPRK